MKKIIVDIDGTIAKIGERLNCILSEPKNWYEFYNRCDEDEPIVEILELVFDLFLTKKYEIVFCSGRTETCEIKTRQWLYENVYYWTTIEEAKNFAFKTKMLLRKNGDKRHDTIVKPELLKNNNIKHNDIAFILEDRNSMVKHWRDMNIKCLQVAEGDF